MEQKISHRRLKPFQREQKPILQNKRGIKNREWVGLGFVLPSLIGVGIFTLIPFLDVIKQSFFGAITGNFVGVQNYQTIIRNDAFRLAVTNTFKFIGVCVPLLVISSLVVAVLVDKLTEMSAFFKTTFLLPMAIPVASVVLLWEILFHQQGILSKWVVAGGGAAVDWMNTGASFWVLVGSYIWRNLGYNMVLWLAGLSTIGEEIYEAASMDGAGKWQQFLYVTLPQLLPTLYIVTVLSILNAFKVFREAYLIAGDYPNEQIYMLQHLFNNWFTHLEMDKLTAGATLMSLAIFILIMLLKNAWGSEEER